MANKANVEISRKLHEAIAVELGATEGQSEWSWESMSPEYRSTMVEASSTLVSAISGAMISEVQRNAAAKKGN